MRNDVAPRQHVSSAVRIARMIHLLLLPQQGKFDLFKAEPSSAGDVPKGPVDGSI
jgi:hypothetical protein